MSGFWGMCDMAKVDNVVLNLKIDAGDFLTENAIAAIRAIVRDEVIAQLGHNRQIQSKLGQ